MLSEIIKEGGIVVVMQWVGGFIEAFLVVVGLRRAFSTDAVPPKDAIFGRREYTYLYNDAEKKYKIDDLRYACLYFFYFIDFMFVWGLPTLPY